MKRTQRNEFPEQQSGKDRQIGRIAKEVEQVAPEVVQQGSDGYLFVDYGRLTPLLIQAIQEQQREIVEKRNQIDDLETRLARVEKLLSKTSASAEGRP